MTATNWVDFKELRSRLKFADVLQFYKVVLKVKGSQATGFCPLPTHPRHDGKRNSPSFSANLERGLFNCFGCGSKGNLLDFACHMEGLNPADPVDLRKVALRMQDRFLGSGSSTDRNTEKRQEEASVHKPQGKTASEAQQKPSEGSARPVVVNAPLDFTLKQLDVEHPYLKQRGFTSETISHFGLGYCSRGLMQERIVIPLHDAAGRLIGYAGRVVDDAKINDENPKYRFPGERKRDGVIHEFRKSLILYNGHRMTAPVNDLMVVEGFPSIWWLWQLGHRDAVALMGSSCSQEQADLICHHVREGGHVWVLTDGDEAGDRCAVDVLSKVSPHRLCRWAKLNGGLQPTDLDQLQLSKMFN